MRRTGGFKEPRCIALEQELPNKKRTAGSAWTRFSAHVSKIKPPKIAVAMGSVLASSGGRFFLTATHEHNGGHDVGQ